VCCFLSFGLLLVTHNDLALTTAVWWSFIFSHFLAVTFCFDALLSKMNFLGEEVTISDRLHFLRLPV